MRAMNIVAAAAFWASVTLPATAWPLVNLSSSGELQQIGHKDKPDQQGYKWERGGCKYEYKADKKGVKEKYECK